MLAMQALRLKLNLNTIPPPPTAELPLLRGAIYITLDSWILDPSTPPAASVRMTYYLLQYPQHTGVFTLT